MVSVHLKLNDSLELHHTLVFHLINFKIDLETHENAKNPALGI